MKLKNLTLLSLALSTLSAQAEISISCGASQGYSYYFAGGLVSKAESGFTEDAISDGKISLTISDTGGADVLTIDAGGAIKSATSQGGQVMALPAGEIGMNWVSLYGDGTIEVYSFNGLSNSVAVYRNTVGNSSIAKNSLFVANCE